VCGQCGLDPRSSSARDTERANAQLHEIARQRSELDAAKERWVAYRKSVLAGAPRRRSDAPAPPAPPPPPFPAAPPVGSAESQAAANDSVETFASPSAPEPDLRAPAGTQPASPMRPARKLSAATLLGVAGAALVILAGIIFVAASWTDYGPVARTAVLVGFSGVVAWLGWLSDRNRFPTIAGSLGVVSAAFAGVAVYAARTGPDGVASFTFPLAVLVGAGVAVALARIGLRAVGLASAGALALAVEAGAFEAALRSDGVVTALSRHSIIGALGAVAVILAARAWTIPLHRSVAQYSGIAVAFGATLTAVVVPYVAASPQWIVVTQLVVALSVCAGIAVWRPRVGAGALTVGVSWSAMGLASLWSAPWGLVLFVGVACGVGMVAALRRSPRDWATPGLLGLAPLALAVALAAGFLLFSAGITILLDLPGTNPLASVSSRWWASAAVLAASLSFMLLESWRHPLPLAQSRWVPAVGAGIGTVSLALVASSGVPQSLAAAGGALTIAAIAQWFIGQWWHRDVRPAVRHAAVVIATAGGLHGAGVLASIAWGDVAGEHGKQWVALGSILLSVAALALATLRAPSTAGVGVALVATAAASAGTWSVTRSGGNVALAAAVAALAVIGVARLVPRRIAVPMAWGAAPAAILAGLVGAIAAVDGVINVTFVGDLYTDGFGAWRGVAIAVVAVIVAPLGAGLWSSGDAAARERTSRGIAAPALVVGTVSGLAWFVDAAGPGSIDYVAAVAVGIAVAAYLVTYVRPWRSSRMVTVVAGSVIVTAQALVVLGHVAAGDRDRLPALLAVAFAVAALGLVAWRHPRVALAPATGVATLSVPAAVLPADAGWALWSAVMTTAAVAWAVLLLGRERRQLVRWGALPVTLIAAGIVPVVLGVSGWTLVRLHDGQTPRPEPMWWIAEAAAVVAVMSFPSVVRRAAWVVAPALAVMAGLVPAPIGWIGLAVAGLVAGDLAIRRRSRWGLSPAIAIALGAVAVPWSATAMWSAAVCLGALTASALWIAVRSRRVLGSTWQPALVVAPLAGAVAVWLACTEAGLDAGPAVVIATGTALAMPVIAVATRLDKGQVAPPLVAIATVGGALATWDAALAGLVILLSCAAWYALSVLGIRWARWVALGGLSAAAVLLLGSVGAETWEAYTAVPAATLIGLGLWWMRKDPAKRTYEALAPGLAVALLPSYLALVFAPQTLLRPLALVFAALVLAIVGVTRRWFAPLLATALTAVVLAVGQIVVHDALVPKWVAFAFVGGVILALGLVAERISKMR